METDGRQRESCSNIYAERRTSSERERDSRARVGENKGGKHGDRQGTRSILCPGSTQREQPHVRVKYRDEYENIWDTSRALFPKPPEGRTLSNGERSEERETRRFL